MKKTIQHKLLTSNETLELEITTHRDFVECLQKASSPFFGNRNKLFINPELQIEQYETVVIRCFISENERSKVLNFAGENSMNITYKVVEEFIKENWAKGEILEELENLSCNHFEHQFKYAIIK
ncbi:hypothetical protein [Flavobacterium sp. ZB4R12]|uniref:hypothetical protein n=1 Tax=Flavobacterium sp. ZB4R12 TaxID=3398732 RepID=UPI003AB0CA05